jgi:Transposase
MGTRSVVACVAGDGFEGRHVHWVGHPTHQGHALWKLLHGGNGMEHYHGDPHALAPWLEAAEQSGVPEVRAFVTKLRQDLPAVEAAVTLPWSQGQVEGHVNRLKLLKRSMYGRAKFDLLKQRALYRVAAA